MLHTPEVSPQLPTTVRKRDGKTTQPFVAEKIESAVRKAWLEAEGAVDDAALRRVAAMAVASLPVGETGVELIQDAVETALMRLQKFSVAKAFIIYRQKRAEARATREAKSIEGFSPFSHTVMQARYAHPTAAGKETWRGVARRVASNVMGAVGERRDLMREVRDLIAERKFMPGGRYLYASGRDFHQTQNCLLLKAEDSREGWADHLGKVTMASMTGAGVGGVYSFLRERGAPVRRTGGVSSGPIALMQMTNETARGAGQGGSRRAALWAGLHWNHPDVSEFIAIKDWSADVRAMKEKDFSSPAPMDYTNISVILDDEFFSAYHDAGHARHSLARDVYWKVVRSMLKSGEPGFSVDVGDNAGEHCRNACTEITSADDSDICNLGSINMARIDSLAEMRRVVEVATAFLLAGTVYSDLPYEKVRQVREKNRRLGLGLLGIHEWLLARGHAYGPCEELVPYLEAYAQSTQHAHAHARRWDLSPSIKTRAVAPTGTIGIVAETTTGMEPIYAAAFKRRYFDSGVWRYQYVLDPTAKKLVGDGVDPDKIEDAYSLAESPDRRVAFQAWLQQYVDHGISSTINLPAWGTPLNCEDRVQSFGDMLIQHLPKLRGITVYPDGARGGQPLSRVAYREAASQEGEVFTESLDVCDLTRAGSCGA